MRSILTIVLVAVCAFTFVAPANAAPLATYDPGTGGVTFSDVSAIVGLRINSLGTPLVSGQATDLGGAAVPPFGVVNDQAPNFIEWGSLIGLNFASAFAGNVFPLGLFQTPEVDGGLQFLYRTSAAPTVDVTGQIVGGLAIPEPGTIALAGLGLVGLLASRRRAC